MTAFDVLRSTHHFRVVDGLSAESRLLRGVMAFPNPFDDQLGSTFSYYLTADGPTDVMLRLFTVSGRAIYQRVERGVSPGYHQWPWNGLDSDGDKLANGVYLFKMVASTSGRSDTYDGRLVKLRKPRRSDATTTP
jgi:flagellar hook assembly protein FlgD